MLVLYKEPWAGQRPVYTYRFFFCYLTVINANQNFKKRALNANQIYTYMISIIYNVSASQLDTV